MKILHSEEQLGGCLCDAAILDPVSSSQQLSWSAQATITRYHGPGGLNNRTVFSSRLEGHDQGAGRLGFW